MVNTLLELYESYVSSEDNKITLDPAVINSLKEVPYYININRSLVSVISRNFINDFNNFYKFSDNTHNNYLISPYKFCTSLNDYVVYHYIPTEYEITLHVYKGILSVLLSEIVIENLGIPSIFEIQQPEQINKIGDKYIFSSNIWEKFINIIKNQHYYIYYLSRYSNRHNKNIYVKEVQIVDISFDNLKKYCFSPIDLIAKDIKTGKIINIRGDDSCWRIYLSKELLEKDIDLNIEIFKDQYECEIHDIDCKIDRIKYDLNNEKLRLKNLEENYINLNNKLNNLFKW